MVNKFSRLVMYAAFATSLVSCGGGGDPHPAPMSIAPMAAAPALSASANGWKQGDSSAAAIGGTDNASRIGPAFSAADPRRPSEGLRESETAVKPDAKLFATAPEARAKALAAGDPVQRAMGSTLQVAPTPVPTPTAATKGMWSQAYTWPIIPIHIAMTPDGRLMSFGTNEGGRQSGKAVFSVFDPAGGLFNGHTVYPKEMLVDIFCASQLFLPTTNEVLTVGGDNLQPDGFTNNTGNNGSTLFRPFDNTIKAGKNMALPRWYATTTTLGNGETFIMGGLGGEAYPEYRDATGNFRSLTGAPTQNLDYWYPRNWLRTDGKIFGYDSYGNYYYITTTGTGTVQIIGQWDVNNFGEAGSAVLFRSGRILQLSAFTNKAAVIDFRGANPTITQTAPMNSRRQNVSGTLLPNGKVLATGGSVVYNEIGAAAGNNNTAATWDPATGAWTLGSDGAISRMYHSIAMLMPDGTVLVGGGGAWGPLSNNNVEFYYPQYLFNANGTLATRPQVTAADTQASHGQTFKLTVSDAAAPITKITMLKTGATTHSLNMDQGYQEPTFTRAGNQLTVTMPSVANDATPGYYMVFALTAAGVPSQARIVRLNVPGETPVTPTAAPTNLTATFTAGTGVTLNWVQSTSAGVTQNIIARSGAAAGPFTNIATIAAGQTYVDNITTAGTAYYTVQAVSPGGPSAASNVASVAVTAAGGSVIAPTGLSGYTCGASCWTTDTGVRFNWTPSTTTGVVNHIAQRASAPGGPWATVATLGAAANVFVDKNVTNGATYYYRVQATTSSAASTYATLSYAITSNISLGSGASIPAQAKVTYTPAGPTAGAVVGLSGTTSIAGTGATIAGYQWTITANGGIVTAFTGATNQSTASITPTAPGTFSVSLTVTDNQGVMNTTVQAITVAAVAVGGNFGIESQGETQYLVMNWWRGNPATEGDFRDPFKVGGSCTGPGTTGGDCYLGARKTFRPMAFNIATTPAAVAGLIVMDVPQFEGGVMTYEHYRLPVYIVKSPGACTFTVKHVRTTAAGQSGTLEFPLNPPGLEILPHTFTMTQVLCDSFPTGAMTQTWLNTLNAALTTYLGAKVTYAPIPYPYSDPRTGIDPAQP